MNENTIPEGTPTPESVALTEAGAPTTVQPELPPALRDVDPAKLKALRDKLAKFKAPAGETISGSEAVDDKPAQGEAAVTTGKDVDWSEYDLEFSVRHLYPAATFRMTPQGPKWVAMVDEFYSTTRRFESLGKDRSDGTPLNLGSFLGNMLNSPEGWRVVSLLPAGTDNVGILLQRQTPVILPDPKPLKKETEVKAPTDGELTQVQDAAAEFMEAEGLVPLTPNQVDEMARTSLEQQALELNPGPVEYPLPLEARTLPVGE